jgi:hypothetical protein
MNYFSPCVRGHQPFNDQGMGDGIPRSSPPPCHIAAKNIIIITVMICKCNRRGREKIEYMISIEKLQRRNPFGNLGINGK